MKIKNNYTVVIAIGGKGTRLNSITSGFPKPLFPVLGKSTLERIILCLINQNFKNILLTISYKSVLFDQFIKEMSDKYDVIIHTYKEEEPLGECGALWEINDLVKSNIIFINGDLIFSIDFDRLLSFHERLDADITLVTHPSSHPEDSDMILSSNGSAIDKLFFKDEALSRGNIKPLLGNAGLSIFKSNLILKVEKPEKNKYPNLFGYFVRNALKISKKIFSYNTSEYIKDMGTEKRFQQVVNDLINKIPEKKNYLNKQKALFLDRDNTLIECSQNEYITSVEQIKFIEKNIIKIAKISGEYTFIVIVTNQPQISMNRLNISDLEQINNHVIHYCRSKGLLIDFVTWCPHHPHVGFTEEIHSLKTDCFCRKPNPGMLLELAFNRNIDLSQSLFIGDSYSDEAAASSVGCRFAHVNSL